MTAIASIGLYSPKEVSVLTGISTDYLRRWLFGARGAEPVWHPEPAQYGIEDALSFLDLMEARFVKGFRDHGVSLQSIREASKYAREIFRTCHPFSTVRFKTDGKAIFAKIAEQGEDDHLVDLLKRQNVMQEVIEPSLTGVVFNETTGHPARWDIPGHPLIQIDPLYAFGKPIVVGCYIPSEALYEAWKVEGENTALVARLYEVKEEQVLAAVAFEKDLAKREVHS